MNEKWFESFLSSTNRAHRRVGGAECLIFTAPEDLEIECWSTGFVFPDGKPMLKEMSPNRVDPHDLAIPKGTTFKVISTLGLSSECELVYWLVGKTWHQAMYGDAALIINNSVKAEDEEDEEG